MASFSVVRAWWASHALALGRRLTYFVVIWSGLLFLHEAGHVWVAARQGREIQRVQIGLGPVVWRGTVTGTEVMIRLIPLAGMTHVAPANGEPPSLTDDATMFGAGIASTMAFAVLIAAVLLVWERGRRQRCIAGRMIAADAVILTLFNLLPVPPLDGGRAALAAITALRGAPLSGDALFWTHASGLALAILPMLIWTRWTRRIDAVAMTWYAPREP